jgi:hypothetical protein
MLNPIFEKFVEKSPVSVMARGMMERLLNPEQLDQWFDETAQAQYTKDLLFSSVFDIMTQVVSGSRPTVSAAHQASKEEIGVSVASVYNKLNGIEVNTSAELVKKIRHCFFRAYQRKKLNCVSDSAAAPHIEASIKRHQCLTSQRKWALLSLSIFLSWS